jgi:hypothetical protein
VLTPVDALAVALALPILASIFIYFTLLSLTSPLRSGFMQLRESVKSRENA